MALAYGICRIRLFCFDLQKYQLTVRCYGNFRILATRKNLLLVFKKHGDKMKLKAAFPFIIIALLSINACTRHIQPPLFDIDTTKLKQFQANLPVAVIVPQNADKNYFINLADPRKSFGADKIYVDLNLMYKNAKELIEKQLSAHNAVVSESAGKQLRFTITKIEWDIWALGNIMGACLEFDIQTADGYSKHYKVQDQSGINVERAVGGTVSRAVEKIFQDDRVIEYVEKQ
jgi:hypothetical protein